MPSTSSNCIDYLIIGQGLAGTLLAHELIKANQSIAIIDPHHQDASSKVAAGLVNPITGRRFVKSWMIDELLPVCIQTYRQLEKKLNISILHQRNIYRALLDAGDENEWNIRSAYPDFLPYVNGQVEQKDFPQGIQPPYQIGELTQSLQVDLPNLIEAFRNFCINESILQTAHFDPTQLTILDDAVVYKSIRASRIIFCQGSQAITNPWFSYLPFVLAKGEVLIIKAPELSLDIIYKNNHTIAPLGQHLYWVGATNDWNVDNNHPTEKGKSTLLENLRLTLNVPFEVVHHLAAIRPTVKDRRPFLGTHPEFSHLSIFNGLGTKGASLGPLWAQKMADFLLNKIPLDPTVNIDRYYKLFVNN